MKAPLKAILSFVLLAASLQAPILVQAQSDYATQPSGLSSGTESSLVEPAVKTRPEENPVTAEGHWDFRIGVLDAFYHSGATIATRDRVMPGANALVTNNVTLMFDIRRFVTRQVSVSLMGGFPPKPTIIGKGSVSSFGEFGKVRYGPAMLTANYHLPKQGAFRPYVGGGVAYAIILKEHDAAASPLTVHNNFGAVFQAGTEYEISRRVALFADFKELRLPVNAHGSLSGTPFTAHVKLDPSIVSLGLRFHLTGAPGAHLFSRLHRVHHKD